MPRRQVTDRSRGVLEVDWPLFGEMSRALALKVARGYDPELVVGIATAGVVPGAVVAAILPMAFVGGLMIDLLAPRPIGLTAFTLLVAIGIAALLGRVIQRGRVVAPIVLIFGLTFVTDILFLWMFSALSGKLEVGDPIQLILPGAIYSTALAVVLSPAAMALHNRFADRERVAW